MREIAWRICDNCVGYGKKSRKTSKKALHNYRVALDAYHASPSTVEKPISPNKTWVNCKHCQGLGIIESQTFSEPNPDKFPHIAIVGLGIGGVALAIACKHRGIPFSIYERDATFDVRSQGYGLTLQQASKALKYFGIKDLKDGIISTLHIVHNISGEVIGQWGQRKWLPDLQSQMDKQSNIHIARQSLRSSLLKQLGNDINVNWGHQLVNYINTGDNFSLNFLENGHEKTTFADIIVGADGIRSTVRKQLLGENTKPLQYLGCLVILGICPLEKLQHLQSQLLDNATVFQTANGNERIYAMPYSQDKVMWQISFPMDEKEAIALSQLGAEALKEEAIRRFNWHEPIPTLLSETESYLITGYPVYDRPVLTTELQDSRQNVTLIGDAAHPMSPFKGQGANQALLDALSLVHQITSKCEKKDWKSMDIRSEILNDYESEMLIRSTIKVNESAAAAKFLHSEDVLEGGNQPRRARSDI